MPSNTDGRNASQVEGVRYSADGSSVLCEHCDCEIERGTDFAVRLTCPEAGIIEPIGPYCRPHMEALKVCCGCHRPFFGEENITYLGEGEYFCNSCKENLIVCGSCDSRTTEDNLVLAPDGSKMCSTCYGKKYFTCSSCSETKTIARSLKESTPLNKAQYPTIFEAGKFTCDLCFSRKKVGVEPVPVTCCKKCGNTHGALDSDYCEECLPHVKDCSKCGKKHHKLQDISVDGKYTSLCPTCKGRAQVCTSCNTTSFNLSVVKGIFGERIKVCTQCAAKKQCSKCLTFVKNLVGVTGMCSNCNNALSSSCDCGSLTGTNDHTSQCRECSVDNAYILNYSTRFSPLQFHYTNTDLKTGDNMFLGFELELGYNGSEGAPSQLKKAYSEGKLPVNYMMAKSDGSIEVDGWEWVAAPQTLSYFNKMKKVGSISYLFKDMFEDTSCGVHIHVSRTAVRNKMHEYKLVAFIDNNEEFIDEISGRTYTNYQRKVEKKPSALILQGGNKARYQRVNLQNQATIELRMYASTVSEYRLSTFMENAHSMVLYTRDASGSEIKGYKGYVAFVKKSNKRYPNLWKFLSSPARSFNK